MKVLETHTALVNRIKWRDDKTVENFTLNVSNAAVGMDRVFQTGHSAITLENIRDCQPILNISEADFNLYLETLRSDCVRQVLNDVFEKDYVEDNIFTLYPTAFDDCIIYRMVIIVSELMMTASRSNRIKRFGDAFVGKLNYDVFREAPNKFAIRGANYNHTLGIATRYGFELESVRRRFGQTRNLLKTITKGQVYEPYGSRSFWN